MKPRIFLLAVVAVALLIAGAIAFFLKSPSIPQLEDPGRLATIYEHDFTPGRAIGPEWNQTKTGKTPKGDRPYLGGFTEQPVELTLKEIPKHKLLRITFDLYLMRCWDGSSKQFGVKLWNLDVVNAQNLLHTTFSTAGFFNDNNEQAFPDTYPCRPLPAWTGAAEKQTLGVMQSWGGPDRTYDTSAVYHFALTFPHTDDNVTFRFSSLLKKSKDKSYGLTNVKVETIPAYTQLTSDELAKHWKALGTGDATEAYTALWQLVTAGDQATDYIAAHLQEPCDATPEQINQWIKDLGTEKDVSKPITGLIVQGRNSAKAVDDGRYRTRDLSPEVHRHLDFIAKIITPYPETLTELRNHRARQLLQIIHTPKSLALAATISAHAEPKGGDDD